MIYLDNAATTYHKPDEVIQLAGKTYSEIIKLKRSIVTKMSRQLMKRWQKI